MRDVQRVAEFFEAAARCQTLTELDDELAHALEYLGFTRFGAFAIAREAPVGAMVPKTVFGRTDAAWLQNYRETRAFNVDAALHEALVQPEPFDFASLEARNLSRSARALFGIMREALPIQGGYMVPVHEADRFTGLFGMYTPERSIPERVKPLLTMMALYAMERARALCDDLPADPIEYCPLSARQREMLAFAAQGKSDWDIGQIVGIAGSTVNEHIEKAKAALRVKTRAQAIAIAVHRGWIVV